MKDLFPGHFKESPENFKALWNNCIFVFDANILLNLYRYSDTTRNEFLRILLKIKDRSWIPHRAAEEYLNNRLTVIDQQESKYDEAIKSINNLKKELDNARQHPFISQELTTKVNEVFDELCKELSANKDTHTKWISNDVIKDEISIIFENKVGPSYAKPKLEQLIIEGAERYKQNIPPGYKDGNKSNDSDVFTEKCRKYGDLIVWNQIIDKSIESGRSIILVTDDKKEDWWKKFNGKTIGPHPELVKEFKDKTNNSFNMYQADRFLELARENLDEQVSEEIVEEIREVRRRDKLEDSKKREINYYPKNKISLDSLSHRQSAIKKEILAMDDECSIIEQSINILETQIKQIKHLMDYNDTLTSEDDNNAEREAISNQYASLLLKRNEYRNRLESRSNKLKELINQVEILEQEINHYVNKINSPDLFWTDNP